MIDAEIRSFLQRLTRSVHDGVSAEREVRRGRTARRQLRQKTCGFESHLGPSCKRPAAVADRIVEAQSDSVVADAIAKTLSDAVKAISETKQVGRAEDMTINKLSGPGVGVAGDLGDEVQRDSLSIKLGETIMPERVGPEFGNAGPAGQTGA